MHLLAGGLGVVALGRRLGSRAMAAALASAAAVANANTPTTTIAALRQQALKR